MAFINVTLEDQSIHCADFSFTLPEELAQQVRLKQTQPRLVFGVRAEDVTLDTQRGDVSGCILTVEPLGDETIYTIKVGDALFHASTPPDTRHASNETVFLSFNRDRIHLFDEQSQQRVL